MYLLINKKVKKHLLAKYNKLYNKKMKIYNFFLNKKF